MNIDARFDEAREIEKERESFENFINDLELAIDTLEDVSEFDSKSAAEMEDGHDKYFVNGKAWGTKQVTNLVKRLMAKYEVV